MKKWLLYGLLLVSMVGFSSGCKNDAKEKAIELTKNNSSYVLHLPSNITTGYQWSVLSMDEKVITVKSHHYIAPETKLIGAGGQEEWIFEATPDAFGKQQSTMVRMIYARPWELAKDRNVEKTSTIKEILFEVK
jgi:inhibitor of cysteine peptidase